MSSVSSGCSSTASSVARSVAGVGGGGGVPAFAPTEISGLLGWWNANDPAGVLSSVSPDVVAVADDHAVRIVDLSGNGMHFNRNANYPRLRSAATTGFGSSAIDLPSISGYATTLPSAAGATCTLFLKSKPVADTYYTWFFDGADFAKWTFIAQNGSATADGRGLNVGTPSYRKDGSDATFTTRQNAYDATHDALTVITMESVNLSSWSRAADKFRLGGYPSGGIDVDGYFVEAILYNRSLTAIERGQVESYMGVT